MSQAEVEDRLYTVIKVARSEDLVQQIGNDIYIDLVDHDKVCSFRDKHTPFNLFKWFSPCERSYLLSVSNVQMFSCNIGKITEVFGIPVQYQRFWLWAKRKNHTYRPIQPLTPLEEAQPVGQLREVSNTVNDAELKLFLEVELGQVGQLREVSNTANDAELKLFLEVELGQDLRPVPPLAKTKSDILLFFKLYDPFKEELRYVGRMFVKRSGLPIEVLPMIKKMAGFGPDEEIELYEEIRFEPAVMCEHIDKINGDIIYLQKLSEIGTEQYRYPDVPSFLEYVHNRQSKLHNYDDVVERVAHHLSLDDRSKIRLTSHNCYFQQPIPHPIKYRGVEHLTDMLLHYNQTSDILYYEVLDIPLPELQGLKKLEVAFHHATKDEVVIHTIRLPKQSTIGDALDDLKTKFRGKAFPFNCWYDA
ncbi:putative Ubiquitin carboxyl-terminal hydrolase [Corchorus olitorius]|uniref:ubiquitinyl hydrolase 1 n=1 Tax=Corchorus olitorius TaxID=93759 RepID=A0A1R3JI32_9ROSI|nr:putative Ubiquitin carboxyl-terminal hydrolase [Corchorus olitorius]